MELLEKLEGNIMKVEVAIISVIFITLGFMGLVTCTALAIATWSNIFFVGIGLSALIMFVGGFLSIFIEQERKADEIGE